MSKYVLVSGGELFNKGAQSMTFVAVDEIKKRFPGAKVVLLSSKDYERSDAEKRIYDFEIMPISTGIIFQLLGGGYKAILDMKSNKQKKKKDEKFIEKYSEILYNTEAIIDVSGYALSSQFSTNRNIGYLSRIMLAKKFNIKMYLMPQSFGPFKYKGTKKYFLNYMIKKYMQYPEMIFVREDEGYKFLKEDFKLKNIKRTYDLVLMNKGVNYSNVYINQPQTLNFNNIKGVGIVPNMKNFKHGKTEEVMSLYSTIINKLRDAGKVVYLIRHSHEDIEACKMIKENFKDNDGVVILADDMSCLDFDKLVSKLDFIIGSRFHSIIHAYKNQVPCIALGWATKYHELLKTFNQEKYIFDVRNGLDQSQVHLAVERMLRDYEKERVVIRDVLNEIQTVNIFDDIKMISNKA